VATPDVNDQVGLNHIQTHKYTNEQQKSVIIRIFIYLTKLAQLEHHSAAGKLGFVSLSYA